MSFVKQAAILAAAMLFARLIGFLYRLPLTHFIGDEGNALYGVSFQFYLFLLVLSSAGLPAAVSKMVSERIARRQYRNAHEVFKAAMTLAVGFGLAGSFLLWIFAGALAEWFRFPESVYAIRAISPAVVLVAVMAVFRGYFQGMGNTVPTAVSQVIEQVFNAAVKVLLAYIFVRHIFFGNLAFAAAGAAAGTGVGALIGLLTLLGIYKMLSPKIYKRISRDNCPTTENRNVLAKEVMYTAFPIILGTAIYSIANSIDTAMVSHRLWASGAFTQGEINALYGQLTGKFMVLTTLPVTVSTALAVAVLPSIAGSAATKDYDAVTGKIKKALRLSTLISIPAAVGIGVLAEPVLYLLFPAHPEGAILLQVGAVSIIFLSLNQVATGALQGIGKIMIPVIGAFVGVAAKIPLNHFFIAIPEINVVGAVISTIVCYLIAASINMAMLKKFTGISLDWLGTFVKPIIAAVVMGLACYVSFNVLAWVNLGNIATLFAIGFGMMVYFLILLLSGGLRAEDMARIPLVRKLAR